jgi:hypothetical protein
MSAAQLSRDFCPKDSIAGVESLLFRLSPQPSASSTVTAPALAHASEDLEELVKKLWVIKFNLDLLSPVRGAAQISGLMTAGVGGCSGSSKCVRKESSPSLDMGLCDMVDLSLVSAFNTHCASSGAMLD